MKFDNIELYHVDCLELMKSIQDESIDMILCDLPYGMTELEFDIRIPFEPLWTQYKRIIKQHGAIVLFSQQPFTTDLINSQRKLFRYEIIWQKTQKVGFLNANKMPLKAHENILVFYKHLPTYHPQKYMVDTDDIGRWRPHSPNRARHYGDVGEAPYVTSAERYPSDVVKFSNWNGTIFGKTTERTVKHPTEKPIPLLEYLIKTYSNEQDLILDNCMGGGSTGVACVNTKRRFIGMEVDQRFFDVATERVEQALKDLENIQQAIGLP